MADYTGEGAVVFTPFASVGNAEVSVSGSGSGVIGSFRGGSIGTKFYVRYKSRPLYVGPEQSSYAEALDSIMYSEFRDIEELKARIISDLKRQYSESDYETGAVVENNQSATGQPYFRHQVQDFPKEGLFGSMFQYEFDKKLPITGDFKYFGFDIHYVLRPDLAPEFMVTGGSLQNAW